MAADDPNTAYTKPVTTKLSVSEKARLDAHCSIYGISPSAVLRDRLFDRPLPTSPLDHVASEIILAAHAVRAAGKRGDPDVVESARQLTQLTRELISVIRDTQ